VALKGGFGTVDAANHNPRAQSVNGFSSVTAQSTASSRRLPCLACGPSAYGMASQALRFYLNLLSTYLTNDPVPFDHQSQFTAS
jgi:hypothetical protein